MQSGLILKRRREMQIKLNKRDREFAQMMADYIHKSPDEVVSRIIGFFISKGIAFVSLGDALTQEEIKSNRDKAAR